MLVPKNPVRLVIGIGILLLIIGVAIFEHNFQHETSNRFQMNMDVPIGFIAIFISFYIFREYNRVKKAKREERREEINQHRQQLLDNLFKAQKKEDNQ